LYELASGELIEYEYGNAELRFMNEIVGTRIIFGPDVCEPSLGVIALEAAGFIVDPKNQKAKEAQGAALKRVA
jgi:hypothetical protein